MNIDRFVLIFSYVLFTLGLLGLFFTYSNQQPIRSLQFYKYVGDIIYFQGEVIDISITSNNNTKIAILDDFGIFYAIVKESPSSFTNCSTIYGRGKLSYYYGGYYIFVFDVRDIKCK